MDSVLLLFRRPLLSVAADPAFPCPVPSWAESLKVKFILLYSIDSLRLEPGTRENKIKRTIPTY